MPLRSPANQRQGYNISTVTQTDILDQIILLGDGNNVTLPIQVTLYQLGIFALEIYVEGTFIVSGTVDFALKLEVLLDGAVVATVNQYQTRAASGSFSYSRTFWINEEDYPVDVEGDGAWDVQIRITDTGGQTSTSIQPGTLLQAAGPFR